MIWFNQTRILYNELYGLCPDRFVVTDQDHYQVLDWCVDNQIEYTFVGRYGEGSVWFIPEESQRVEFVLRWK